MRPGTGEPAWPRRGTPCSRRTPPTSIACWPGTTAATTRPACTSAPVRTRSRSSQTAKRELDQLIGIAAHARRGRRGWLPLDDEVGEAAQGAQPPLRDQALV